ncbi:MAG: hypothetical protein HYZ87_00075 [Candidatus Omnitrophica bacterium]|nr:hypothetical protein [Candidatus Omnitrophota bacterium]
MICLIESKAGAKKISEMLETLGGYIKVAVDIRRGVLAGGGIMHADCEAVLLKSGSKQVDVWGADWYPKEEKVECHSLINIRPRQNNRSMEIQDSKIRAEVERVVRGLLG